MPALATVALLALAGAAAGAAAGAVVPRIVGGGSASIDDFPWQVSVLLWEEHHCGGSIIAAARVLTAAHCITMAYTYQVRAGSTNLSGGTVYEVYDKKLHEHFNSPPYNNDVAILKIRPEFELGKRVQIIPLAVSRPPPGAWVTVSGWGMTSENGDTADELRACQVRVIEKSECRRCYHDEQLTESMLCAGVPQGGKDACGGDSGGPLVYRRRLAGVVSFGKGCGRADRPGGYADVVTLRDWITEHADMR